MGAAVATNVTVHTVMKKLPKILFISILVLAAMFLLVKYVISGLIFYGEGMWSSSDSYARDADPWREHAVSFETDGATLRGWLFHRPGQPLVVFYGGKGQDSSRLLGRLSGQLPYSILVVNYRGYGQSTGTPSERAIVDDALQILDETVLKLGLTYNEVVLLGDSLGSGVAVQVAAYRTVGKVVLMVPFDSVAAVADGLASPLPLSWLLTDTYRSDAYAPMVKSPVAIMAAGKDEQVPVMHARTLADVFRQREGAGQAVSYREYDESQHRDLWEQPGFFDDLKAEIDGVTNRF